MSRVAGSPPSTDFAECENGPDGVNVDEDNAGGCDPNHAGACIPDVGYDLDCDEVAGADFEVVGEDAHGFDRDRDGSACESYGATRSCRSPLDDKTRPDAASWR